MRVSRHCDQIGRPDSPAALAPPTSRICNPNHNCVIHVRRCSPPVARVRRPPTSTRNVTFYSTLWMASSRGQSLVDPGAEAADLAAADTLHAHGADRVVRRAGTDAPDIGLPGSSASASSRRSCEGPRRPGSRSRAELGDRHLDGHSPGLPVAVPVEPLRCTVRSGLRSPWAGPVTSPTSTSISRQAAKAIISRGKMAADPAGRLWSPTQQLPKGDLVFGQGQGVLVTATQTTNDHSAGRPRRSANLSQGLRYATRALSIL